MSGMQPDAPTRDLADFIAGNRGALLRFVAKRVPERAAAEDVLQDAVARGLTHAADVRDAAALRAWFYRILRNAIADYHRVYARDERRAQALATAPAHDDALEQTACRCVGRLKDALKPDYADAIARVEMDGMTVKFFANERGISAGNAAVRVFRARAALRKEVMKTCGACAERGCRDCSCDA